jgi:translation initiation factor 2 beta subunit (eIF-2beta)/eIF-5
MSKATRAPTGATSTRTIEFASESDGHRVIYHEPICPDCGSFDITEAEIDTGDNISELGLTCEACGTAWPVACVVDWTTTPAPGR